MCVCVYTSFFRLAAAVLTVCVRLLMGTLQEESNVSQPAPPLSDGVRPNMQCMHTCTHSRTHTHSLTLADEETGKRSANDEWIDFFFSDAELVWEKFQVRPPQLPSFRARVWLLCALWWAISSSPPFLFLPPSFFPPLSSSLLKSSPFSPSPSLPIPTVCAAVCCIQHA